MIISASRRTDIPAFYSEWFYNRLEQGYVYVRNPMNEHQVSKIVLNQDVVDCFVFWSKNPKPFIKRLFQLHNYSYYFHYTLTGYGRKMEPYVPELQDSINCFIALSKTIGRQAIIWRYDPIIITDIFTVEYHLNTFETIARQLSGYTDECIISFVDYYKKTIKNLSGIDYYDITSDRINVLAQTFNELGQRYGITIKTCAEEIDLSKYGIDHAKCIDNKRIETIIGSSLKTEKDKNQRAACGCVTSIDIGSYNSCPHGCLYCYANYDMKRVHNNFAQHDKYSALLFGKVAQDDIITDRKMFSCKTN